MFVMSVKLSRKRVLTGLAALVLVVGIGVTGVRLVQGGETMAIGSPPTATSTEKVKQKKISAKTNEDRVAFAASFGWEVAAEPAEVLEVIIPKEFDSVYQEYNAIQKKQGLDLEKYAGKRCKRYSYAITNHPTAEGEVRINLLVYGDKIVGGDVCCLESGGFMHGFTAE